MEMAAAAERGNEPESDRIGTVLRTGKGAGAGREQGQAREEHNLQLKQKPFRPSLPPSPHSLPLIPARSTRRYSETGRLRATAGAHRPTGGQRAARKEGGVNARKECGEQEAEIA